MPRDMQGPERPQRPQKPILVIPSTPDTEIIVQGVTFTLSQDTQYNGGDISFYHPAPIGQFVPNGNGKIKVLENQYNFPISIENPKNVLLLDIVGHKGSQQVVPMITKTQLLHDIPIDKKIKIEALNQTMPYATYIHSTGYSIFNENGELNIVISEMVKDINNWLSGNRFFCDTEHPLWKPEMCEYNTDSFTSHIAILNGMMNDYRNLKPKNMETEIAKCLARCEEMGIDDPALIDLQKRFTEFSVKENNKRYERFKGWAAM